MLKLPARIATLLDELRQGKFSKLPLFALNTNSFVAVEINDAAVKLLSLSKNNGSFKVEAFGIVPLADKAVINNEIKNVEAVNSALNALREQANLKANSVITSLPGTAVIIKQITINNHLNQNEMEAMVWVEANKHFPDIIDDISLDFDVLNISKEDENKLDVLLVACRKAVIEPRTNIINDIGLITKVVDVDYYALERIYPQLLCQLPQSGPDDIIAIINININIATLVVIQHNNIIYTHDYSIQDTPLPVEPNKFLQWDANQKTLATAQYMEKLSPWLHGAVAEFNHLLEFYYSAAKTHTISHLFLAGELMLLPTVAELAQNYINIPVSIANPFINMEVAPHVDKEKLFAFAPAFAVCAGLAIRGCEHGTH